MDRIACLTSREREVLSLLAAGRSDLGISETLVVTPKTVEFHTRNIFRKLELRVDRADNRRVIAALTFVRHSTRRETVYERTSTP